MDFAIYADFPDLVVHWKLNDDHLAIASLGGFDAEDHQRQIDGAGPG